MTLSPVHTLRGVFNIRTVIEPGVHTLRGPDGYAWNHAVYCLDVKDSNGTTMFIVMVSGLRFVGVDVTSIEDGSWMVSGFLSIYADGSAIVTKG